MKSKNKGVFSPKVLIPVIAVGAVAVGTVGILQLLNRHGEAAISILPADSLFALSFDNTPSPNQVPLFNDIRNAMEDSGLNKTIDEMLIAFDQKGALREIRSLLRGSFAVGVFGDITTEPNVVLVAAVRDMPAAEALVGRTSKALNTTGFRYYEIMESNAFVTFRDGYALVSNTKQGLDECIDVANGKSQSLYQEPGFQEARKALPSDATLMIFANGRAMAQNEPELLKIYESMGMTEDSWVAYSFTLRREGILIDCTQPIAKLSEKYLQWIHDMPPVSFSSLSAYPDGAIGVAGMSNPGGLIRMIVDLMQTDPTVSEEIYAGIEELEQSLGMSFESDILSALRGEFNIALYPPKERGSDPRIILSIDNSNGGTASAAALKLIERVNSGAFDKGEDRPRVEIKQSGSYKVAIPQEKKEKDGVLLISDEHVMIVNDVEFAERVTQGVGNHSLLSSDSYINLQNNMQYRAIFQLDLNALFGSLVKSGAMDQDTSAQVRGVLTKSHITANWTLNDKTSHMTMLIPIDLPALIRMAGKQMNEAFQMGDGFTFGEEWDVPEGEWEYYDERYERNHEHHDNEESKEKNDSYSINHKLLPRSVTNVLKELIAA